MFYLKRPYRLATIIMGYMLLRVRSLSTAADKVAMKSSNDLKIAILTGTTRTAGPPRPILGPRVCSFIQQALKRRGNNQVSVIDPLERKLPLLEKPHFAYAASQIPSELKEIQNILVEADAYVCITPEYNHAPSPGLLNILNHFGSSVFSFKPSAIVSYSAGQWGGVRAAHSLRPILSELGAIPVSAMIHIPKAGEVLTESGDPAEGGKENNESRDWDSYVDRCVAQLEWWAEAAKLHKERRDPFDVSPAFLTSPSQRNAP